jgi:hypothetical protein
MTNHIDLGTVLRQTLSASLYSNLVTRPTGRAVRTQIERLLVTSRAHGDGGVGGGGRRLTVIDFSHVSMIDFSCADEIIAKLLLSAQLDSDVYFLFRGMNDGHWHSIETVLERHGLALVVEDERGVELVGVLDDRERRAWQAVKRRGRAAAPVLAEDLGEPVAVVRGDLDRLCRRRLLMRHDDFYMPVSEIS